MSTTSSRYSVENFDPTPDEELVCSICRCVFDEPVECPCRHIFCRICISSWLDLKPSCPICRKRVHVFNLQEVVPLIKNMIAKLNMVCPNRSNGCKVKVNLENFNQHVKGCQHEQMPCKNKNCQQSFLRKDIERHENTECDFRMVLCERHCNLMLPSSRIKQHDCIKELKKQLEESSKREESLNKHIEELTNELNTLKKQAADDRNNPFNFSPNSPLFDFDSSSSSSDSSMSSTSPVSDVTDADTERRRSVIQSLHSRLYRMSSFMSSVDFLSRLDGTSRRSSSSNNNSNSSNNNSNNLDESRESTGVTVLSDGSYMTTIPLNYTSSSDSSEENASNVENNSSVSSSSGPVFRHNGSEGDDLSSGTPSTSLSLQDSLEADDEFPTAAQRRILKRKRTTPVVNISSETEATDSEVDIRRRRPSVANRNHSNASNRNGRRAPANGRNRGNVIPRSIVPVEITDSRESRSEDDTPSTVSRGNGLERTRELLELFSVETDPDWEPSAGSATSDGEVLANVRSVPAAELLDSIIDDDDNSEEDMSLEFFVSASEFETDNDDYEILVPERTYDLLNRYTQEDSDEDEDWLPRSTRSNS